VLIVVSPRAGHASASPDTLLRGAGVAVAEVVPVSALDHNLPQGEQWRKQGIAAVVAAGGDGTLGAVATQVVGSGLPMGILPMGTSNDSARSLGISMDLGGAVQAIATGIPTEVDVGMVTPALTEPGALSTDGASPGGGVRAPSLGAQHAALAARGAYFMHALTLGLNVEFARLATDVAHRNRWGNLTYAASALEAITRFQAVPITLRLRGVRHEGAQGATDAPAAADVTVSCRVVQLAVVNLPVFGGALNLRLPDVGGHDRLLDFVVIEALEPHPLHETVERLVAALGRLRDAIFPGANHGTGRAELTDEAAGLALPGVRRYQAREATIETPEDVDVTLDGEIRARTPVQVRVASDPVHVLLTDEARRFLGAEGSAGQRVGDGHGNRHA
jgi:diacylglycerol kinase family enzyme